VHGVNVTSAQCGGVRCEFIVVQYDERKKGARGRRETTYVTCFSAGSRDLGWDWDGIDVDVDVPLVLEGGVDRDAWKLAQSVLRCFFCSATSSAGAVSGAGSTCS